VTRRRAVGQGRRLSVDVGCRLAEGGGRGAAETRTG
jgi:hypothetical protein